MSDKLEYIKKLTEFFRGKEVFYRPEDKYRNVTFYNEKKEVKIAYDCFYRVSGICCTHKDTEKAHEVLVVDISDDSFYNVYMKTILMEHFFPKPKIAVK